MKFGWEKPTDRLKRHMNISPQKKLELLYELNCFTKKYAVRRTVEKAKPFRSFLKSIGKNQSTE